MNRWKAFLLKEKPPVIQVPDFLARAQLICVWRLILMRRTNKILTYIRLRTGGSFGSSACSELNHPHSREFKAASSGETASPLPRTSSPPCTQRKASAAAAATAAQLLWGGTECRFGWRWMKLLPISSKFALSFKIQYNSAQTISGPPGCFPFWSN